jgi:hypothetical protein
MQMYTETFQCISLKSIKLSRIEALWLIRVVGMFRIGLFLSVRRRSCCCVPRQEMRGIWVTGSVPCCLWLWGWSLSCLLVPCFLSVVLPAGAVPSGPWARPLPRCMCVSPRRPLAHTSAIAPHASQVIDVPPEPCGAPRVPHRPLPLGAAPRTASPNAGF